MLRRYRMAIPASLCVDVYAHNAKDAKAQAELITGELDTWDAAAEIGGLVRVEGLRYEDIGGRFYCAKGAITVQNVDTLDPDEIAAVEAKETV